MACMVDMQEPARCLAFNTGALRPGFPVCHAFSPAKDGVDTLIGLNDGSGAQPGVHCGVVILHEHCMFQAYNAA